MKKQTLILIGIIFLSISLLIYLFTISSKPSKLDGFAICLKDKGVKFYGAFWCSHCQNQKALFGTSEKLLPYIECSTPDGNRQLDICIQKKIETYPTWFFPDESSKSGELSLQELSEKSSCQLP